MLNVHVKTFIFRARTVQFFSFTFSFFFFFFFS